MSKYSETTNISGVTVERKFNGGIGVLGTFTKNDGSTGYKRWTVWTPVPVATGDVVNISGGVVSTKVEKYTNKSGEEVTTAALHVNNATVTATISGAPAADESAPF
jgi:hypothetical protein